MATTEQWVLGTAATLMSTELNALASSATAGAISAATYNNVQGGGGGNGYTRGRLQLDLGTTTAMTAGTAVNVWFLRQNAAGTGYEYGSASALPARAPDVIFAVPAATPPTELVTTVDELPPGIFLTLINQQTGVTWAATGNTLTLIPYTPQGV